jgi:prevent-host-death family protein
LYECRRDGYDLSRLDRTEDPMKKWQVQEAKQQFSRVVELARDEGPQIVTRNGREVAVVLDIKDYRRLHSDGGAFKRFLESAPDLDALEIERPDEPARSVEF